MMPKISDVFQMYLRELRPADMQGSVGLYRLKEELLLRVNKIVYPAQVNDLLFKEVLVQ
jgi:flagellar FliL protein